MTREHHKCDHCPHSSKSDDEDHRSLEDMSPPPTRNSRSSKRNSGFFDVGYSQLQLRSQEQAQVVVGQKRTSKRASSQDRHGQIYGDDIPGFRRPETPEMIVDSVTAQTSPLHDSTMGVSPRRKHDDPTRYEFPPGTQHLILRENREISDPSKLGRDNTQRPRTRTLEERIRSRSPATNRGDIRKRIGSFQSVGQINMQEGPEQAGAGSTANSGGGGGSGNSIGYPSMISNALSNAANTSRQRLLQYPMRPVSPGTTVTATPSLHSTTTSVTAVGSDITSPPVTIQTDAERIMTLMRATRGRMHGILSFRFSTHSPWQSGYCAINTSTGSLIYQTRGELAQTKTLITDLRGCKVRTQFDLETKTPFLEMSTKASGYDIHLRPQLPETFESWLAALLCWQPIRPGGSQHAAGLSREKPWRRTLTTTTTSGTSTPTSSMTLERASSRATMHSRQEVDIHASMREAPVLKTAKVLWWDPTTPQSTPIAPPRRVSTYIQQRMAAGPPWRKAVASVRDNGLFEVLLESAKDKEGSERGPSIAASVDLGGLHRYAVQRLHSSVLDDEYSLAVFTQYKIESGDTDNDEEDLYRPFPVFVSFETRVLLEAWYAMFRAFTVPELYGPGVSPAESVMHPTSPESAESKIPEDTFRVKRSLFIRITEAHLHAPRQPPNPDAPPQQPYSRDDALDGDYHAEIQIDGDVRGRTPIQSDTSNPFWRNDYEFTHLPPLAATATIFVKSRQAGQRDWTLISDNRYTPEEFQDADHLDMVEDIHISPLDILHGSVQLKLDEMDRGLNIEQWWTLTNKHGEITGRILLKIRVDETVILMSNEYDELKSLLHAFSNGVATEAVEKCGDVAPYIHETLLNIFQVSNSAHRWITTMIEDEIDSLQRDVTASRYRSRRIASNDSYDSGVERELILRDLGKSASANANLLFRGNTPLTKALEMHMRRLGKEYLEDVLGERLRDIDESEPECEVDPNRCDPQALERNWRNLILLTESIWRSISKSANACPPELRQIFRHIRACTEDRYGAFLRTIAYSSVSAFLFLRLLVPAILSPSLFGLLKEVPRMKSRRTLVLIAKSLQSLANMTTFGTKEPWMERMNSFVAGHRQEFKDFIDEICSISQERVSQPPPLPRDFSAPLRVAQELPAPSREGFPSLPYLIDQSREIATLVNAWMDSRVQSGSVPVITDDLARLDILSTRLKERTREVLRRTVASASAGGSTSNLERLLKQLDARGRSSKTNSRIASPLTSPKPTQTEQDSSRPTSQGPRPQPIRTSTSQTAPVHRSSISGGGPPSGASLEGFAAVAAATRAMLSPSAKIFGDPRADEDELDDDEDGTPSISAADEPQMAGHNRMASIAGGGAAGLMNPLAWQEPGSAGSGHSQAGSVQDAHIEHVNHMFSVGDQTHGLESSALPSASSTGLGVEMNEPSPMTSPRETEPRFLEKLSFRRREKKEKTEKERRDEDEAARKARKKEEKEKKKEEKKKDKEKGREKGSILTGGNDAEGRLGFNLVP